MRRMANLSRRTAIGVLSVAALAVASGTALAANQVLKIGFVGVTSGPAAAWGTSNVRSMQTRADWLNETGGVKIGDTTYDILMARAAGTHGIGVSWGVHEAEELVAAGAHRVVHRFEDIPPIVRALTGEG